MYDPLKAKARVVILAGAAALIGIGIVITSPFWGPATIATGVVVLIVTGISIKIPLSNYAVIPFVIISA